MDAAVMNGQAVSARPIGARVLLKRDEAKSETEFGIVLPGASIEKPRTATVIAVGRGQLAPDLGHRIEMEVEPGQRVVLTEHGGFEVTLDDEVYLVATESDILLVLD